MIPFNVMQVALEGDPHIQIMGNAVEMDGSELKVGIPLETVFDDATPEDTIPHRRRRRA